MVGWKWALGWVLGMLGLAGTPAAQESHAQARAALFREQVEAVEALVDWAQEERLYLERDRLCEALIALEPDHAEARKFLRYRRVKGAWEREGYRPPQNRAEASLEEFGKRRDGLVARWRGEVLGLAGRFELDAKERMQMWDDLLILAPDDAEARSHRGEVRDPRGAWVLQETEAARVRRAHLRERAAAIAAVQPAITPLERTSDELSLGWKEALASEDVRLFGACEADEARAILRGAQGSVALFRDVFDEVPVLSSDFTLYVIAGESAERAFLEKHADDLDGTVRWIGASETIATGPAERAHRLEQIVQATFRHMLMQTYGLDPASQAWALEGFSLRFTELATGHPDVEIHAPDTKGSTSAPLARGRKEPETLWQAARAAVRERDADLVALLAKKHEEYTRADVLQAYAFAAYLAEAHGERLARLLDSVGYGGGAPVECLERALGMELATIERRFARWVAEVEAG